MLGAFICLLTNYAKFMLKVKIKEITQNIESIGVKKGNVEILSEFPDHLVIKTISRQSRIREKKSITLFPGSDLIDICFRQIVIKNEHKILCLRGEIDARHDSVINEFITMAGAELEENGVDINLCSCSDINDIDKLYLVIKQSFKGFSINLLFDDVRFLDSVERGEDGIIEVPVAASTFRFKTIDGVSYMYKEDKEELLNRKLAHMNFDCRKTCCTDLDGERLSRLELTDQMIEDLELVVHGKEQNKHQKAFFRDARRRGKEQQYINLAEKNWDDGKRTGRGYGVEKKGRNETSYRALRPGPLSSYVISKEEEKLFSEQFVGEGGMKKKSKDKSKKVTIGGRGKGEGNNTTKSYGKAKNYQALS